MNVPVTTVPLEQRAPLTGSAEQLADDLAELRALGIAQVFWLMLDVPLDQHLPDLEPLVAEHAA